MTQKNTINLAAMLLVGAMVQQASAQTVFGLTTRNELLRFDASNPGALMQASFINGLQAGESLVGMDFRPSNNELYGVGSFGRLYQINTTTAQATYLNTLVDSVTGMPIQLNGTEFGVDFNPVPDRLRLISNLGQNFRINVATGSAIVDGAINQASGTPYIVSSAYLNNDNDPSTGTTLYNIDSSRDVLTIQNPPNAGTQVDVGPLGADVTALAGFDIYTVGTSNTAYAALQVAGTQGSRLATINLSTGTATFIGQIGREQTSDSNAVRDIAVQPVPEPATMLGLGAALSAFVLRRKRRQN